MSSEGHCQSPQNWGQMKRNKILRQLLMLLGSVCYAGGTHWNERYSCSYWCQNGLRFGMLNTVSQITALWISEKLESAHQLLLSSMSAFFPQLTWIFIKFGYEWPELGGGGGYLLINKYPTLNDNVNMFRYKLCTEASHNLTFTDAWSRNRQWQCEYCKRQMITLLLIIISQNPTACPQK